MTLMGISGHPWAMDRIRLKGSVIRDAYADMGLSRSEFAELCQVPPKTLTNITAPDPNRTSRRTAARIALALGREVDELIESKNDKRPKDNRPPNKPKRPPEKKPVKNEVAA